MGYYTEFKFNAKINPSQEALELLKRVIIENDLGLGDKTMFQSADVFKPDLSHKFFKCDRWYILFTSGNWSNRGPVSTLKQAGKYWDLSIHSEFKNYDDEIDNFIDWIKPFVIGQKKKQYLGYWQGEDMDGEINIYIERRNLLSPQ